MLALAFPRLTLAAVALALLATETSLRARVVPAPVFSNGSILQQGCPIPVFGSAEPGEKILIQFKSLRIAAIADAQGRWIAEFPAMPASSEPTAMIIDGSSHVEIQDLLVGEVWLYTGEFEKSLSSESPSLHLSAPLPLVRQFRASPNPTWIQSIPKNQDRMNSLAFSFARDLHSRLGIPIGVIVCVRDSSSLEAWLPRTAFSSDSELSHAMQSWTAASRDFPSRRSAFDAAMAQWKADEVKARNRGSLFAAEYRKKAPFPSSIPPSPGIYPPTQLFESEIRNLIPYSVRGLILFHCETRPPELSDYSKALSSLLRSWRSQWRNDSMPVLMVQVPPLIDPRDLSGRSMAYVRQAQALLAHGTGHISIVTSIDLPATRSFVASPQVELGKRIARHTRGVVYDAVSEAFGPTPIAFTREGTSLRIRFSNAGEGLVSHDRPIQSLEIASADKIFHPATARINGDSIIVSEASTTVPVYVRYAWSNAPTANLFNGSGSAAAPFLGAVGNP